MYLSLQDLLQPATALKNHGFGLPLSLTSRSEILVNLSPANERASSFHTFGRDGDAASTVYQSANPRFKTEICRNFKEKGTCLYGDLCQFAHGKHELRGDVVRHAKYKTKPCQKYWVAGYCAYGPRCNFVHQVTLPSFCWQQLLTIRVFCFCRKWTGRPPSNC